MYNLTQFWNYLGVVALLLGFWLSLCGLLTPPSTGFGEMDRTTFIWGGPVFTQNAYRVQIFGGSLMITGGLLLILGRLGRPARRRPGRGAR
jgi:hypothetical protein